jgi:uncharacterized protein
MSDFGTTNDDRRGVPPPLPGNYGKAIAPVSARERIVALDVVRGVALLGILISNMLYFSQPHGALGFRQELWFGPADRFADWISMILIEGKFYPLFSILFGMGVSMQMDRAWSLGIDFKAVYQRRLFMLMGFGLLHGILLWEGDVLLAYALCGFALLLFKNRKPLTLLIWSAIFILAPSSLILLLGLALHLLSGNPAIQTAMNEFYAEDDLTRTELTRIFVNGSYMDVVFYRLGELIYTVMVTLFYASAFLGLFLIGMLAARKGIFVDVLNHKRMLSRIVVVCGAIGLTANFLGAWIQMNGLVKWDYGQILMGNGIISIFGSVLSFAYIAGLVLLIHRWPWVEFFSLIASVGRMALTNYLAQSLIATTIFYGYGFGLGGNVGRMGTIGIALLIFAGQILFSVSWLKFYRYGPMEWLWRSLAYGVRQPMVRER